MGVSYQKTGRFDLSGCSILKSQTAAKDLNLTIENAWQKGVDVICISKTMGTTVTENYFSVSPALMELLSIQVTIQSENALLLGTEKVSIELKMQIRCVILYLFLQIERIYSFIHKMGN